MLDREAPGVRLTPYRLLDGSWAADVHCEGAVVSAEAMLVGPQTADVVVDEAINQAILALGGETVGIMREVIFTTRDYIKSRVQFGKPLSTYQVLQHRIADMFVAYQDAVSILHYAIAEHASDRNSGRAAVSAAKVAISDAALVVGELGIQLHGAMGVTEENAIGRFYKRFLVFRGLFGTRTQHLDRYNDCISGIML